MKQEEFTTVVIKPEEGKFLTQAGEIEILERAVATTVAIGRYDSPDNWKEITAEEANEIREEQKRVRAEEERKIDNVSQDQDI